MDGSHEVVVLVDVVVEGHDLDAVLEDEAAGGKVLLRAPDRGQAQLEWHHVELMADGGTKTVARQVPELLRLPRLVPFKLREAL